MTSIPHSPEGRFHRALRTGGVWELRKVLPDTVEMKASVVKTPWFVCFENGNFVN